MSGMIDGEKNPYDQSQLAQRNTIDGLFHFVRQHVNELVCT